MSKSGSNRPNSVCFAAKMVVESTFYPMTFGVSVGWATLPNCFHQIWNIPVMKCHNFASENPIFWKKKVSWWKSQFLENQAHPNSQMVLMVVFSSDVTWFCAFLRNDIVLSLCNHNKGMEVVALVTAEVDIVCVARVVHADHDMRPSG